MYIDNIGIMAKGSYQKIFLVKVKIMLLKQSFGLDVAMNKTSIPERLTFTIYYAETNYVHPYYL